VAVGINVGSITDEIGSGDFLHAFFSTISANLEERWGSRFPVLMNGLYQGSLPAAEAEASLVELASAQAGLSQFLQSESSGTSKIRTSSRPGGVIFHRTSPTCPTTSSLPLGAIFLRSCERRWKRSVMKESLHRSFLHEGPQWVESEHSLFAERSRR
jgi:hypothetical protein